MADIGDIDHVIDVVTAVFECAAQDILEDIGAVIADVLEVVDGRTAGIKADLIGFDGGKEALFRA